MSIPKIGTAKPGQKSADEGKVDKAAAAPSTGFTGSSGFDAGPAVKVSTQKLSIDLGGILGSAGTSFGSGLGSDAVSSLLGPSEGVSGDFLGAAKAAMGVTGIFGENSNDTLGPLGTVFKGDSVFGNVITKGFNNLTSSLGRKVMDTVKGGLAEGMSNKPGAGLDGMSKEVEKKFWDIYFMKNILNGSKEAQKEQEKAMKKALKDMGVNVPDDAGHADVPTVWDFWAYDAAKRAGVKDDFAKWKFIGGPKPDRFKAPSKPTAAP